VTVCGCLERCVVPFSRACPHQLTHTHTPWPRTLPSPTCQCTVVVDAAVAFNMLLLGHIHSITTIWLYPPRADDTATYRARLLTTTSLTAAAITIKWHSIAFHLLSHTQLGHTHTRTHIRTHACMHPCTHPRPPGPPPPPPRGGPRSLLSKEIAEKAKRLENHAVLALGGVRVRTRELERKRMKRRWRW
jgi:hypothetical protein